MRFPRLLAVSFALVLSGCWAHSLPMGGNFIRPVVRPAVWAETVQVFVDPNGTFYPASWQRDFKPTAIRRADSLLNAANEGLRHQIERDEERQLAELAQFARSKSRIFVLVHGYNNTQKEAEDAYRLIEPRLDLQPRDGVVRFFWDGLRATAPGGGAKIWWNATGYSQLAGSRGLRRILDQFADKEIYLIGHSRGTSVILSAVGNPVYDPAFLQQTRQVARHWGPRYANLLTPAPLAERGNRIHVIVMAPAVDRIDFCDASQQPAVRGRYRCEVLRKFSPQLKSFRYTVNPRDYILRKFVGASGGFNPTGLGQNPWVGQELQGTYTFLKPYPFAQALRIHGFSTYVEHPTFEQMLSDAGILRR